MATNSTDPSKIAAAIAFLKRTKTQAEIEAIAVTAFAAVQSGKVVTSVNFEGGGAASVVDFFPGDLLNACETALQQLAGLQQGINNIQNDRIIFPDFSPGLTRT